MYAQVSTIKSTLYTTSVHNLILFVNCILLFVKYLLKLGDIHETVISRINRWLILYALDLHHVPSCNYLLQHFTIPSQA